MRAVSPSSTAIEATDLPPDRRVKYFVSAGAYLLAARVEAVLHPQVLARTDYITGALNSRQFHNFLF